MRMRRSWMAGAALLLLIAAIGVLWSRERDAPAPTTPPTADGVASTDSQGVDSRDAGGDAAIQGDADLDALRSAVGRPATGRRTWFVVREADSLAVVPGAQVLYFPPRTDAQRQIDEDRLDRDDREEVLRQAGRTAIADGEGRVDVVLDPGCTVCARAGDRYGELSLDGDDVPGVPRTIWLQRDVQLIVDVVDPAGRPCVGVRVEVSCHVVSRQRGAATFDNSVPTDAAGRIVWRHLQERGISPANDVVEAHIDVQCAGHEDATQRRLRIEDLAVPVRLVVPVGGIVHLCMLDADGLPMPSAFGSLRGDTLVLHPSTGLAENLVFAQVPLGRRWRACVRSDLGQEQAAEQVFDGPVQAGEVVAVTVRSPVRRWSVRGRITWQGIPQLGMTVSFDGVPDAFAREFERVATSSTGVFVLRGHAPMDVAPAPIALTVTSPYGVEEKVVTRRDLRAGEVDLGDLAVNPGDADEPLAIVRVLADGRDITAGSWVQVEGSTGGRRGGHRTVTRLGPRGLEVRGVPVAGSLQLWIGSYGRLGARRTIEPGASLTVELEAAASLRTSVLMPAGACELRLVRAGDVGDTDDGMSPQSEQWPWYQFFGVTPGRYCLAVRVQDVVVHRTAAFDVAAGANVWPSDGSAFDLRGVVRIVHAAVIDALTGRTIDGCSWFRDAKNGDEPRSAAGAPWFRAADGLGDVLVLADGYVPMRVSALESDVRISLQPLTRLRVQTTAGTERVVVRVVADGVRDETLRRLCGDDIDGERTFDATDPIEMTFAPGTQLEFAVTTTGVTGLTHRVVVDAASPQLVALP